jgi:hypothetical protein
VSSPRLLTGKIGRNNYDLEESGVIAHLGYLRTDRLCCDLPAATTCSTLRLLCPYLGKGYSPKEGTMDTTEVTIALDTIVVFGAKAEPLSCSSSPSEH